MPTKASYRKKRSNKEGSRERVLQAAEELFNEFGYNSVTVHHIAEKLGIKAASLYYHAPGGKEELFVMVLERSLARHRQGIADAIENAGSDLRARCLGVIGWFLSQGPLGFLRLLISDLAGLDDRNADRLRKMTHDSLLSPISKIFDEASSQGAIQLAQPELLASSLLSMVDGIWYASAVQKAPDSMQEMAENYVDMMINGLLPR